MLDQNVYIMFRAGNMGSYLKWMIEHSAGLDAIDNPLTPEGNTHNHVRTPTHVPYQYLLSWLLYRKPEYKQVYLFNPPTHSIKKLRAIQTLLEGDPNAVIINIHQNDDELIEKYAFLNQAKTWPVSFRANYRHNPHQYHPFEDEDKHSAMIWLYHNWKTYFHKNSPLTQDERVMLMQFFNEKAIWFDERNKVSPDEILAEEYPLITGFPKRYHEICVTDIVGDNIVNQIAEIVEGIGKFDFSHAKQFHPTFQDAKPNKDWFKHIERHRKSGTIDPWFGENILSQAFLLHELNLHDGWENKTYQEIVDYHNSILGHEYLLY